jgi:hypothetical protein
LSGRQEAPARNAGCGAGAVRGVRVGSSETAPNRTRQADPSSPSGKEDAWQCRAIAHQSRFARRDTLLRCAPVALPGQTFVFPMGRMLYRAGFVASGLAFANTSVRTRQAGPS